MYALTLPRTRVLALNMCPESYGSPRRFCRSDLPSSKVLFRIDRLCQAPITMRASFSELTLHECLA